ncbi:uncharacterized protein LOC110654259 isoform X1 [Hevea brasiliensis]|uniref:uncharacterized protein LOC110654259 isoform X1 n=1 Tax=Hevea brasiliensis TaxID=3981 RepID=UPI000B76BD1F|nr:uncharacterized protein LOC110654259 isoform X1 [Hevea brasiliensis]
MKRSVSEKLMLHRQKKKGDDRKNRFLITINVLGSAGPIRFVVNEDDPVAGVIDTALKTYSREGRLPALGSDVNNFLLYCANAGSDGSNSNSLIKSSLVQGSCFLWQMNGIMPMNPWEPIGSGGGRSFVLCKKQGQPQMTEGRSEMIAHKASGWKAWLNKSFSFKVLSH